MPILSLSELRIAPAAAQTAVRQMLRAGQHSCIGGRSSARQRSGGASSKQTGNGERLASGEPMAGSLKRAKSTQKRCAEVCGGVRGAQRQAEGEPQRAENYRSRPILGFFEGGNSRGPLERGRAGQAGRSPSSCAFVGVISRFNGQLLTGGGGFVGNPK